MGKLMYSFRIAVTLLGIAIFVGLYFSGMGSFLLGLFRFGDSSVYVHVKDGAIYDENKELFKLTFDKESGMTMDGIEVIFYDDEGGSNNFIWRGKVKKQKNTIYFDVGKCSEKLTNVVSIAILDGELKSIPTKRVNVKKENIETTGIIYNLCNTCKVGGDGTISNPIVICSCSDLINISRNLQSNYILGNSIDCSKTKFSKIGNDITPFRGSLNGNGYSVYNIEITGDEDYSALIGVLYEGEVKNIGVVNGKVEGNLFTAGLVGRQEKGQIKNSFVKNMVIKGAANTGGLVGYSNGDIINSYSISDVYASIYGGGIVGGFAGNLKNTYYVGNVTSIYKGFIGKTFDSASVENSYYNGEFLKDVNTITGLKRTTDELKKQSTYTNWDFDSTWKISEGISYPELMIF